MRRALLIGTMTLALAGCNYFTPGTEQNASLLANIKMVQDKAVALCGFFPTEDSVAGMLLSTNPTVLACTAGQTAECVTGIASSICSVLRTKPFGLFGFGETPSPTVDSVGQYYTEDTCPRVNGVCIDGTFMLSGGKTE